MIEQLKEELKKTLLEIDELKNFMATEEFGDLDASDKADATGELEYLEDKVKKIEEEISRLSQQDGPPRRTLDNTRLQAAFDEAGLTVEDLGYITETRPESDPVSSSPNVFPNNVVNTEEAKKALEEMNLLLEHQIEIRKKIDDINEKIIMEIGQNPQNREQNKRLAAEQDKVKAYQLYLEQVDFHSAGLEEVAKGGDLEEWKQKNREQMLVQSAGSEVPEVIKLQTSWNGVLSDEEIFKQYEEARKIPRPLEQRVSISFRDSTDKSIQERTVDFFDYLTKKFDEFIANRPTDTTTFTGSRPSGHSLKWTIWNDKIIYIDLAMIKPERQGEFATSLMIGETVRWMEQFGMHIVTMPANEWVHKSMKNNGGIELGDGHFYFGTDLKQFEKDWLSLYSEDVGPASTYMDRYADLVKSYTELTAAQREKFLEVVNQSNLDANEMALVDSYVKEIGIDDVVFEDLDLYRMSTMFRVARDDMSMRDYFKIRNTGILEDLLEGVGRIDNLDNIWNWMLSTESGVAFLTESLLEMEAQNVDTSSEKYTDSQKLKEVLERRLKSRYLLNDVTLTPKEQERLLYSFGRQHSPYDAAESRGWYLDTHQWQFKVTDSDVESFKKLYEPEFRKSFIESLLGTQNEYASETLEVFEKFIEEYKTAIEMNDEGKAFEIKRKYNNILRVYFKSLDYLQSDNITIDAHPTLDIKDGLLNVYHASTPINAALGFRTPEWDKDSMGGRTSGHGSNTYFATSSNYTQDYRGFGGIRLEGRTTYVYQIDLFNSGIANENILNYYRPMSSQLTEDLLESIRESMGDNFWKQSLPQIQDFLATESGRGYKNFKDFITREIGFKRPLSWWIDALKNAGIKVVYHPDTGRGDRQNTRIMTSDGPVTIKGGTHTNGRNEEELLFLEPETLEYEVRELRRTGGATTTTHSRITEDDIIEFDKKNAIRDLIGGYYNRLGNTVIKDFPGNAYYLEDLLREFKTEITNRPRNVLYDEYIKQLESVVKQVRNLIDEEGLTGKQILNEIDFSKLAQDVPGSHITIIHNASAVAAGWVPKLPEVESGTVLDSDDILYRYEINENNVQVKKFYKVLANDIGEDKFVLVGEDGIKIETHYDTAFIYDENINNPENQNQLRRLEYIRARIGRAQDYVESLNKPIEVTPDGTLQKNKQTTLLSELLTNQFTDRVLRIPVYYRNNEGVPLNPEDIRAGYNKGRKPIATPQGDIEYLDIVEDLFTPRNTGGSITFSLDTHLKNDQTFYEMTGEKVKPGATDNFFQIEVNTKNIVTLQQLRTGGWLTNFDIDSAAGAFNLPKYKLLDYLEEAGLIERPRNNFEIVGKSFFGSLESQTSPLGADNILNERTVKLAKLISPNKEVELVINKLLRAGGIEGYVNQPFLTMKDLLTEAERTGTFITLFDPNDYAGVGKHIPIVKIDAPEGAATQVVDSVMDTFETVVGEDTPPLTRYEDLDIAYDQRVLDEGFENRELFNRGFNAAEKEALGLTGEIGDLVNDNILDKNTTQRVIETGNLIDDVTAINDATEMVISQVEDAIPLSEQEAYEQMIKAIQEGRYVDLELLTRRGRAKALLNKKIYQFYNYKGKVGAGIAFLDYYEIVLFATAATYGARSITGPRFQDHLFDLTKGILGKEYDVDSLELDVEEMSKAMETADKFSPFNWLYRKIGERPFWQTVGDFDWKVQYGDEGFGPKPINPYKGPGVFQTLTTAAIAGIAPYLRMDDLMPPYQPVYFDDIVDRVGNPGYNFIGPVRSLADFPTPTGPTIGPLTAEEIDTSPWGRFWLQFKDNYKDYNNRKIEEAKNPFWGGEHTPAVIRDENPSVMGIHERYGAPGKKWYDKGRSW